MPGRERRTDHAGVRAELRAADHHRGEALRVLVGGFLDALEEEVAHARHAASDHEHFRVDHLLQVGERDADVPQRLRDHPARHRLARFGEGEGFGVYGVVFKGRRFDTGDKLSYLKAVITLASERVEFGEDLKTWMKGFVN